MVIGVIVHSKTGNTLELAKEIKVVLEEKHTVEITELKESFPIDVPEVAQYDALVFGSSVEAMAIEPHMKRIMKCIPTLQGKKVFNFTNQFFPFSILGGMQARNKMRKIVTKKGGQLLGDAIVHWLPSKRKEGDLLLLREQVKKAFA